MTSPANSDSSDAPSIAMRSFDQSLPMALLQARESAMQLFRPLLSEYDLTEQQWRVLRALASGDTSMEVAEIADATFLLAPSLSRILRDLRERGLVDRRAVAGDLRRASISLTSAGHDLVATVAPRSETIYSQIEEAFGQEALTRLLQQLDSLRSDISQLTERTR